VIILLILVLYILWRDLAKKPAPAPDSSGGAISLFDRSPAPDRTRLKVLGYTIIGLYAISVTGLYFLWYKRSKLDAFHWFDDRGEWNQMDKAGHIFGGYFQTMWGYELLRWCGLSNKQSAVIGAMLGISIQSSIEVMDGFSSKYGASYSDLCANVTGALICASQYWMWEEQRVMLKFSYDGGGYPQGELGERASDLFGDTFFDKALKDYNHMTLWASVNPSKFYPGVYPKWLCYSVGYSAENLYGGFQNVWEDKDGRKHNRSDLPRSMPICPGLTMAIKKSWRYLRCSIFSRCHSPAYNINGRQGNL
jgi:uncharacterized protein YfiM (DUF2279 family)